MRSSNSAELVKNFVEKNNKRFYGVDSKYYDVTLYDYFDSGYFRDEMVCTFGRPYETPVFDNDFADSYIRGVFTRSAGVYFEQVSISGIITPKVPLSQHELEEYCEYINKINANKVDSLFPKNNLVEEACSREIVCEYIPEHSLNGGLPCVVNQLMLAFRRDSVIYKIPENEYEEDKLYMMNFNTMNHFFGKYILEISDYLIDQVCNEYNTYMNPPEDSFYVGI